MARRGSFQAAINKVARDGARRQRQVEQDRKRQERALAQQQREAERLTKETERTSQQSAKMAAKEAKEKHLAELAQNAADQNAELAERVAELRSVLEHTLAVDDAISFDSLRQSTDYPAFQIPADLSKPISEPQKSDYLSVVRKPTGLGGMLGITRKAYEKLLAEAEAQYETDYRVFVAARTAREASITLKETEYEEQCKAALADAQRTNQEVDELTRLYQASDPQAIITYNAMVLERSEYPDGFPQEFRLAYVPESKELVVEYEMPPVDVIPTVADYRFAKSKGAIEEVARKAAEIKELYQDVVAAVALRTIHEVMEADQPGHVTLVTFNGFVSTVDPTTGRDVRPCLISVRVTRDRFSELNLARVDKRSCLRNLGAQVSPRPAEMQAVKPIVEFDMVDKRFVEASDILGDLEGRPNLMDLTPFEFENLVSNLFGRMGLDTRQTRSSRDGGVDCIAFDTRPVLGGKVVIQAKRYSNTVGVSAVRDLYGTMMNEGANKGILVATSSYGPDAYDFAKDKPIELIDGGSLLYLLEQNDVKARIVFADGS